MVTGIKALSDTDRQKHLKAIGEHQRPSIGINVASGST